MSTKQPRRPDFRVTALDRKTEHKGEIGVAWLEADGSISVRLNFLTVIDMRTQDLIIKMWPNDKKRFNDGYPDPKLNEVPPTSPPY